MALWKKILIGVIIAGGTIGYLIYTLLSAQSWRCELCITYKGQSACRAALAETRKAAYSTAAHTACAVLANGVTERIGCPNTRPSSVTCKKR